MSLIVHGKSHLPRECRRLCIIFPDVFSTANLILTKRFERSKPVRFFETLEKKTGTYPTTQHNIPKNLNFLQHCYEKRKFCINFPKLINTLNFPELCLVLRCVAHKKKQPIDRAENNTSIYCFSLYRNHDLLLFQNNIPIGLFPTHENNFHPVQCNQSNVAIVTDYILED